MPFTLGVGLLVIVSLLIFFGVAQRALDRMRLSDKGAFFIIGLLVIGSYIDIPISRGNIDISLNLGGGLVPVGIAVYLLSKAGTGKEKVRALTGALITGLTIYLIGSVLMRGGHDEFTAIVDTIYIYPIVGGLVAYILGRSRRAAFVSATIGVLLLDFFHLLYLFTQRVPGTIHIGGAGAFDSIVIAGIFAVLLADFIGETRERLQGGPKSEGRNPELIKNLKSIKSTSMLGVFNKARRGDNNEEK